MARLPALVSAYAELDGRPRKSIEWYARVARENGKIASAKRGAGAANMNARDAVNLILACNCAEEAKDAPIVIDQLRSLRRLINVSVWDDPISVLGPLIAESSFGLALEALLTMSSDLLEYFFDRLNDIFFSDMDQTEIEGLLGQMIGLEVELWRYGASITLWEAFQGPREVLFQLNYAPRLQDVLADLYLPEPPVHRSVRVRLSFEIFRRCAELIGPGGQKMIGENKRPHENGGD